MSPLREIITIDSSSDDDELEDTTAGPSSQSADRSYIHLNDVGEGFLLREAASIVEGGEPDLHTRLQACVQSVTEFFPDISQDHIQSLYTGYLESIGVDEIVNLPQILIGRILDDGSYPKEKDELTTLKELKRKRDDAIMGDAEALKWKNNGIQAKSTVYSKISRVVLQDSFPLVPSRYLDDSFKEHGHLYGAFIAVADIERNYAKDKGPPYARLKTRRHQMRTSYQELLDKAESDERHSVDELEAEIDAATRRRNIEDRIYEENIREFAQKAMREQEEIDRGETFECGCCVDNIPISRITHCNADNPHFFCLQCARMNAESDIGSNKHTLQCMDGSQCKATFSRTERAKFLDDKIIEKVDNLEQQAAIRLAMDDLQDFVTCPFCQYGHICPPVEEDKEFRCRYPECKEVSCRLCKEKSHIPLSCEEYKKENGIGERRIIEEARTEALIRTCPKCKVRILKEDGCNKVVCTTCSSAICDYCGKDITSERYDHFECQGEVHTASKSGKKCPLYDQSDNRKDQQIEAAERAAMEQIRKENPELSEDDLTIKFSEEVRKSRLTNRMRPHNIPGVPHMQLAPPPIPPFPVPVQVLHPPQPGIVINGDQRALHGAPVEAEQVLRRARRALTQQNRVGQLRHQPPPPLNDGFYPQNGGYHRFDILPIQQQIMDDTGKQRNQQHLPADRHVQSLPQAQTNPNHHQMPRTALEQWQQPQNISDVQDRAVSQRQQQRHRQRIEVPIRANLNSAGGLPDSPQNNQTHRRVRGHVPTERHAASKPKTRAADVLAPWSTNTNQQPAPARNQARTGWHATFEPKAGAADMLAPWGANAEQQPAFANNQAPENRFADEWWGGIHPEWRSEGNKGR